MSEAVFLILSSARSRASARLRHLVRDGVEALTSGRVRLSTGTLYGALRRLLAEGWIRRVRESPGYARPANVCRLTAGGQTDSYAAEVERCAI